MKHMATGIILYTEVAIYQKVRAIHEIHRNANGHVDDVCNVVSKTTDRGVWLRYEYGKSNYKKSEAEGVTDFV